MLVFDRWEMRAIPYEVHHLAALWVKLQEFPTLFSDITRGDIQNWISMIKDESWVWYEVLEKGERVGIIYFQLTSADKIDAHLAFFDRKPAEKRELIRFFADFLFKTLPALNKICASVPAIYHATWRLVKNVGFKWEGTLREDVTFNGNRVDVHLYGLLRSDLYGVSEREGQGDQLNSHRYPSSASTDRESAGTRA